MSEPRTPGPIPEVTHATSTNRQGTLAVRANDQGLPTDIRVDRRELRYGAEALAAEILRLSRSAALEARARRRVELAEAGITAEVLDRLGLPTRTEVDQRLAAADDADLSPTTWMRRV
ncbi:hypothetical protein OG921_14985 [Aldersonia sp. NBC_00410]|uniref:hypothetical protein n=1 Tax=Aldersonia sp. NBC_00410 TaxID=2975954 RepID=UPI002257A7B3|nr:hypothetical protein [Aldersonia sp. NBC_00410]MCX5044473.1 hypothetical protein [Aldersonia sp. NBC_00410]